MSLYKRGLSVGQDVVVSSGDAQQDLTVGSVVTIGVVGAVAILLLRSKTGGGGRHHQPLRRKFIIGTGGAHRGLGGDMRAIIRQREYGL